MPTTARAVHSEARALTLLHGIWDESEPSLTRIHVQIDTNITVPESVYGARSTGTSSGAQNYGGNHVSYGILGV